MVCVMADRTNSKDAIAKMNEALQLMDASVKQLRSLVVDLNEGKLEIVDGDNDNDNER